MPHPIAQHLYKIQAQTGDNFFKLWDDWLGLAVAALSRQEGEDDERYMTIMRTYGPRIPGRDHPADHFAHALGTFLHTCRTESALNGSFPDILGTIYEQEAITNRYTGQFFTPEHLCKMMAIMTVAPTQEPITIADPACGSGRFFIAAMPLAPNATFYGTDRDLTCVNMTALNMLTRNANAYVIYGNTLSMECFGGYVTRSTALGGIMRRLDAATALSLLTATSKAEAIQWPAPVSLTEPARRQPSDEPQASLPVVQDKKGQFGFEF